MAKIIGRDIKVILTQTHPQVSVATFHGLEDMLHYLLVSNGEDFCRKVQTEVLPKAIAECGRRKEDSEEEDEDIPF